MPSSSATNPLGTPSGLITEQTANSGLNDDPTAELRKPHDYLSEVASRAIDDHKPVDRIFRIYYDELTIDSSISQDNITHPCKSIIDTACGDSYLIIPSKCENPFRTHHHRAEAIAVNGTVSPIHSAVDCLLTISDTTHSVKLKVFHSSVDDEIGILFGRELQSLFKIVTRYGTQVAMGNKVLFKGYPQDKIRRVIDNDESPFSTQGMTDMTPSEIIPVPSEAVSFPLADAQQSLIENLLSELAKTPPQPLPRCSGSMRFRPLSKNEIRDTTDQEYCFEMTLDPCRIPVSSPRLYAQAMYSKLTNESSESFKDQISEYVSKGWWTKADRSECETRSCGAVANVFGTQQKSKLRLVCDFRNFNLNYPSTTTGMPRIDYSLATLRIQPCGNLIVGDCSSAFYRVRLTQPVWLHCGSCGDFLCHRLCFGLSMGPEALQESLGVLWKLFGKITSGMGSLFVDDFWLRLDPQNSYDYKIFIQLLSLCGFSVPSKKFQLFCPDNDQSTISILGCDISVSPNISIIDCQRQRLQSCAHIFDILQPTKSDIYALAGVLAYDPAKSHIAAKICADLLRSVSGRAKVGWHVPIPHDQLDMPLFLALMDWAKELVETDSTCSHECVLPDIDSNTMTLRFFCDASYMGGGYIIQFLANDVWSDLYSEGWLWKKAELDYHSNRLEAVALFKSLRTISGLATQYISSRMGKEQLTINVQAFTDSSTALAWAMKGHTSTGYEGRMIERLCLGLHTEILFIRHFATFAIQHIPGDKNDKADALSRILNRQVGAGTMADLVRKFYGKDSKSAKRKGDTVRRIIDSDPPTLAEQCCKNSPTIFSAIKKFTLLRACLQSWGRAKLLRIQDEQGNTNQATTQSLPTPLSEFPPDDYEQIDFDHFFISCQQSISSESLYSIQPFRKSENGLILHTRIDYNGTVLVCPVVPKSCYRVQKLIVWTYHRIIHHRGTLFTSSAIRGFWLENRDAVVCSTLRSCLVCRIKNARVQWSLSTNTYERNLTLAPFSRVAIDHLFLEDVICLTVNCLDTAVFAIFVTPNNSTSVDDSIVCLKRLCYRYALRLQLIHCDQSSTFTSPKFLDALRSFGQDQVKLQFTVPNASYTNPVERLHKETLSIIRTSQFIRLCILTEDKAQDTLDEIASIINQRPIGKYYPENDEAGDGNIAILTPAILAWGAQFISTNKKLLELRKFFYEKCFATLRRINRVNRHQRRGNIMVGETVLLYRPKSKMKSPFEVCKVIDIKGAYIQVEGRGKILTVGNSQLARLPPPPQSNSPFDVSRVGARIAASFVDSPSSAAINYFGTVVTDFGETAEVCWDSIDGSHWSNEIIAWGACRIVDNDSH